MILYATPATTTILPVPKVGKAAFLFAFGDFPAYLDSARRFARAAIAKQFPHIVIFTDEDCTRANFELVIRESGSYLQEDGLCFATVSTHGARTGTDSEIQFAAGGVFSTTDLKMILDKVTEKVRVLIAFEACHSDRLLSVWQHRRSRFARWVGFNRPGRQFSFPNASVLRLDETRSGASQTVPSSSSVLVIGCAGLVGSNCDCGYSGCLATSMEIMLDRNPTNYSQLVENMNTVLPCLGQSKPWVYVISSLGPNAAAFVKSSPLS